MGQLFTDLQAVRLDVEANAVIILDQTSLPGEKVYLSLSTKEAVWDAIHRLKVRGAPADRHYGGLRDLRVLQIAACEEVR